MRLITRRIYRAFPELNRYSDEQCERFVKATRGSWVRKCTRALVISIVGLASVVVALVGAAYLADWLASGVEPSTDTPVGLGALVLAGILALGPIAGFFARTSSTPPMRSPGR